MGSSQSSSEQEVKKLMRPADNNIQTEPKKPLVSVVPIDESIKKAILSRNISLPKQSEIEVLFEAIDTDHHNYVDLKEMIIGFKNLDIYIPQTAEFKMEQISIMLDRKDFIVFMYKLLAFYEGSCTPEDILFFIRAGDTCQITKQSLLTILIQLKYDNRLIKLATSGPLTMDYKQFKYFVSEIQKHLNESKQINEFGLNYLLIYQNYNKNFTFNQFADFVKNSCRQINFTRYQLALIMDILGYTTKFDENEFLHLMRVLDSRTQAEFLYNICKPGIQSEISKNIVINVVYKLGYDLSNAFLQKILSKLPYNMTQQQFGQLVRYLEDIQRDTVQICNYNSAVIYKQFHPDADDNLKASWINFSTNCNLLFGSELIQDFQLFKQQYVILSSLFQFANKENICKLFNRLTLPYERELSLGVIRNILVEQYKLDKNFIYVAAKYYANYFRQKVFQLNGIEAFIQFLFLVLTKNIDAIRICNFQRIQNSILFVWFVSFEEQQLRDKEDLDIKTGEIRPPEPEKKPEGKPDTGNVKPDKDLEGESRFESEQKESCGDHVHPPMSWPDMVPPINNSSGKDVISGVVPRPPSVKDEISGVIPPGTNQIPGGDKDSIDVINPSTKPVGDKDISGINPKPSESSDSDQIQSGVVPRPPSSKDEISGVVPGQSRPRPDKDISGVLPPGTSDKDLIASGIIPHPGHNRPGRDPNKDSIASIPVIIPPNLPPKQVINATGPLPPNVILHANNQEPVYRFPNIPNPEMPLFTGKPTIISPDRLDEIAGEVPFNDDKQFVKTDEHEFVIPVLPKLETLDTRLEVSSFGRQYDPEELFLVFLKLSKYQPLVDIREVYGACKTGTDRLKQLSRLVLNYEVTDGRRIYQTVLNFQQFQRLYAMFRLQNAENGRALLFLASDVNFDGVIDRAEYLRAVSQKRAVLNEGLVLNAMSEQEFYDEL